MHKLKELNDRMVKALTDARTLAKAVEDEDRNFTTDERTTVAGYLEEARDLKNQIMDLKADEDMRRQIADLDGVFGPAAEDTTKGRKASGSLGEQFVQSEQWKSWLKGIAPSGHVPDSLKGINSTPVEFKNLLKTLVTGSSVTSAGAFVETDYTGIYEALGRYPLRVVDLISRRSTMSDLVEFVRQTVQVQQAAMVPEANVTDYAAYEGEVSGIKPEGAIGFEKVQESVKTVAVWVPATKRALSDAAQIRGIIDNELKEDLNEELEDQIVNGDGTGENFTGILNTSGILSQAWTTDILTTTRKAITHLWVTGKTRPTAWLMNPADWETIELLKDGDNRYYWGGPMVRGAQQLWGLPVVPSQTIASGSALLANWGKCVLWDREAATIQVSDSHADFFIRNMVAILAELRAAMGVIRPSAFCEVELASGS